MIEGNVNSGYHVDEIAHGLGYLDHPEFGPFFHELLESLREGALISGTAPGVNDRVIKHAVPNPVYL